MVIKNLRIQSATDEEKEELRAEWEKLFDQKQSQKKPKKISTFKFHNLRYKLASLGLVLLVALAAFFAISYKEDNVTPQQHLKEVAGQSIIKTAKFVNPSAEEKRYYSTLIMGIDTRDVEFNGEEYVATQAGGTRKIDVILQVIYDREKNKMTFISIPRDTSITATEPCMHQEREDQKYINRFYDMAEKNNCPFTGPEAMMKYASYITGFGIDHYMIVTLDSFVQLIDVVGVDHEGQKGVWIESPRNIADYCPNDSFGYNYVFYPKGRQFMTSSEALCYIRVRKTSNDFDRNRRQQQLITQVMKLLTNDSTLKDPMKMYELYKKFKPQMQMSKVSLQDITMGIEIMSEINLQNIQKIVLDYEFGGRNALLTKPLYSPPGTHTRSGYYLIPTAWDQSCCVNDEWRLVRQYLHKKIDDPNSLPEQAAIYAYVNTYTGGQAVFQNSEYQSFKIQAPEQFVFYNESKYAVAMLSAGPDVQIYDFTNGQKRAIAEKIAELSGGQVYDGSQAPFKPLNHEEISVIVRVK